MAIEVYKLPDPISVPTDRPNICTEVGWLDEVRTNMKPVERETIADKTYSVRAVDVAVRFQVYARIALHDGFDCPRDTGAGRCPWRPISR